MTKGKPIAAMWGNAATLKRLRAEMKLWAHIKSGAYKANHHGNTPG